MTENQTPKTLDDNVLKVLSSYEFLKTQGKDKLRSKPWDGEVRENLGITTADANGNQVPFYGEPGLANRILDINIDNLLQTISQEVNRDSYAGYKASYYEPLEEEFKSVAQYNILETLIEGGLLDESKATDKLKEVIKGVARVSSLKKILRDENAKEEDILGALMQYRGMKDPKALVASLMSAHGYSESVRGFANQVARAMEKEVISSLQKYEGNAMTDIEATYKEDKPATYADVVFSMYGASKVQEKAQESRAQEQGKD